MFAPQCSILLMQCVSSPARYGAISINGRHQHIFILVSVSLYIISLFHFCHFTYKHKLMVVFQILDWKTIRKCKELATSPNHFLLHNIFVQQTLQVQAGLSSHYSCIPCTFLTPNIHYRYQEEKETRIAISELIQANVTLCHISSSMYTHTPFLKKSYSSLPAPASYAPLSWRWLDALLCRRIAPV